MKGNVVADIRELSAELDAEDLELVQLFRGRHVCNEQLLVEADGQKWLVSKTEAARAEKIREDRKRAALIGGVGAAVMCAMGAVLGGMGNMYAMLAVIEAGILLLISKTVPWEVRR